MKWPRLPFVEAATLATLLLAPLPASAMLQCKDLVVDGHKFDFGELEGPHTITTSEFHPPTYTNTTYTLDLCTFLKRKSDAKKDEDCPNGTRVCAIRHNVDPRKEDKDADEVTHVIAIAGNLLEHGGKAFDWSAQRLSTSDALGDSEKEGVRLTMSGGMYASREQKAVIELLCDKDRTGLEGEWDSKPKDSKGKDSKGKDSKGKDSEDKDSEDKDASDGPETDKPERLAGMNGDKPATVDDLGFPERQLKKDNTALVWEGYGHSENKDVDILRLTWHTKYACENGVGPSDQNNHWGFFTWIVILVFLSTAAYLIFGSWINYYRYGARGWDLLPHSDTLRDIPYLLKDWTRRFLNTVQGSGSRGGYSAV